MNKNLWIGVSFTLLASLQAAAQGDLQIAIEKSGLQSIEKTANGDFILIKKDGAQLLIDKKIVEALKNADLNSAPSFDDSNPCVAITD